MRKVISSRKIISLIIVAILASISIFWYFNRYIYKSRAGENTVKVNLSTSEPTVPTAKDFFTSINLSDQKIAALDFSLVYDSTRMNYYKETHPNESGIVQIQTIYDDVTLEEVKDAVELGAGKKRLRIVLLSTANTDIKVGQIISLKFTSKAEGTASFELEKNKFFVAGTDINGNPADFSIEFQNNTTSITISNPPTPTPTITPTPTPTCSGYNYFDEPASNTTIIKGSTILLKGWARFCYGPAGQGVRNRVDLHLFDVTGNTAIKAVAGSVDSENRIDTSSYCGSGNLNSNGWKYNWTVDIPPGSYMLKSTAVNDAGNNCKLRSEKNITIINPTPTIDPCPNFAKGNANCDPQGSITLADFACWRYEYINHEVEDGCGGAQKKSADFNSSNSVTLFDFAISRSSYSRP